MVKICRIFIVLLLTSLVIMGLNTSNQGINDLTMANRNAVIRLSLDNDSINLDLLGKRHNWSESKFPDGLRLFWEKGKLLIKEGKRFLISCI